MNAKNSNITKSKSSETRRQEQIALARQRRESALKKVRKEKRIMLATSLTACLSVLVWTAAVSTDHWYSVTSPSDNSTYEYDEDFVSSTTGLFRTCKVFKTNNYSEILEERCSYHALGQPPRGGGVIVDVHVIDYTRTSIIFSIISVFLMAISIVSAFYTFKNSRFIYKRLAAGLYFVTAFCILTVLEVVVTTIAYEKKNIPRNQPPEFITKYGPCFYIGWTVFGIYLVNACVFLVYSGKRKNINQEDEGETIIGR